MGQEDQIVPVQLQGVDDFVVEGLPGLGVLQLGVPQGGEELVLLAVRHLLGGKYNVDELLAQGARQGFLQKSQVLGGLLLGHAAHGLVQVGDDLLIAVDKATVDAVDGALVRAEAAFQLAQFFLIHSRSSFVGSQGFSRRQTCRMETRVLF